MATFTDNFNRANENPTAAPWQAVSAGGALSGSGLKVDTNQLVGNGGTNASVLAGLQFTPDQSAEITIATANTFCPAGVIVRGDTSGNGYLLYYNKNGDDVRLGTLVNGTFTNVKFFGDVGFVDGSSLGLSVSGNTLTAFIDGVQLGTPYEDTSDTYTTGVTGVWYDNQNQNLTKLDDFSSTGWVDVQVTDVDTDEVIEDGQQNVPFTVSGFSGDITTASITVGAYTAPLTGLEGTGTSYTVDLFDVSSFSSDTAGIPFTTANHVNSFEASDVTNSAALTITRNPKTGWAVVDTVGAVATQGSVFENRVGGAMSDRSQVLYPTASNTTIAPDGTITTDADTVEGKAWDVDTGTWETFTVNFASVEPPVIVESGYNPSNPPGLIAQMVGKNGASMWEYDSTDSPADVRKNGYITNGVALGMKVGDVVTQIDTVGATVHHMYTVKSLNSDGSVNLSDGTAIN